VLFIPTWNVFLYNGHGNPSYNLSFFIKKWKCLFPRMHRYFSIGHFVYLLLMVVSFSLLCTRAFFYLCCQVVCFSFLSACAGSPAGGGQYPAISSAHREKPASHVWSWAPCTTSTKMQCCSGWWGPLAASTTPKDVWKAGVPGTAADGVEVRKIALKSSWAEPCCLRCCWLTVNGGDKCRA